MSVLERELKNKILQIKYYNNNQNTDYTFKDKSINLCVDLEKNIFNSLPDSLKSISFDILIEIAESCHSVNTQQTIDISEKILKFYFDFELTTLPSQTQINKNNFYIRALLIKAQIEMRNIETKDLKAEDAIACLKTSTGYIQKALEVVSKPENKSKYAFLAYNASIIAFNILKNYFKPNWAKNFVEILEKLSQILEETDDVDYNWRLRFLIKLAQTYLDADKKPEGAKVLDKISDLLKKKGESEFQEELFRYRVHLSRENTSSLAVLKKEAELAVSMPQLKYIHLLQCIKSGVVVENSLEKEVQSLITSIYADYYKIVNTSKNSLLISDTYINMELVSKIETWKADVLAELAFILTRYKSPSILLLSYNIYQVLIACRSNTLKGKIFLENIRALMNLHKLEGEIKKNSYKDSENLQKRIETRAESIKILERNLSGCTRIADIDLINETCMLIFNLSIPFMKKNSRKHFAKAFHTSSDLLEHTNSNEAQLRASMHLELAKGYLEDDLLQDCDMHLTKALILDYSVPQTKLQSLYSFKISEPNTNISYLQRNLEQFLVYLKRTVSVRLNIYQEPENVIDKLIIEAENIKNSKYDEIKIDSIKKCVDFINSFSIENFNSENFLHSSNKEKDYVEEEIALMKIKYDLKIYEDKKHFTLIALDISKLAYDLLQYDAVLKINEKLNTFVKEWSNVKDIDQILALSESNLLCAKCHEEFLSNEGIEVGSQEIVFFRKQYGNSNTVLSPENISGIDKEKFNKWKQNFLTHIKESIRLAISVSQFWFLFNSAATFWNAYFPIITSPNFLAICNEMATNVLADFFDGLNSGISYYESLNWEANDTEYINKLDIFVNIISIYAKLLDARGKQDECIRVCEVMLSRNMNSNQRKIFDTIKARAVITGGKKGVSGASKQPNAGKAKQAVGISLINFTPTADQLLISESFQTLESAANTREEKTKIDLLKKGIDCLKNVKINQSDDALLEISSELWYKYGIQYFSLNNYLNFKLAMFCADNCVKTYKKESEKELSAISSNILRWYSVGFLLYGDCIDKLVDKDKHERSAQITLYFTAMEKIVTSAKTAEKCNQYYVIKQCVKAFYSLVIKVVDQPPIRESLVKHFLDIHNIMIDNRTGAATLYSDPEFLLLFYSLFCICINEAKQWELGEKVVSESLKIIPTAFHNFLLEHKLFYFSKLGKNFIQNLTQGDTATHNEKETFSRAKLLTKLARSSTDKKDQFTAYTKAIEMLKNDSNIYVSDVLFEFATWLYKNNYPSEDVEDSLNEAVDILIEVEPAFDEDDAADEMNSMYSNRSTSSRHSRISKRSRTKTISKVSDRKKTSNASLSKLNSKDLNSKKSALRSRNHTNKDVRTKTVFAKILDFEPYPLFMNISHCEQLLKLHVFLSMVTQDSQKKIGYLLDAFMFLIKIFEISLKTLSCIEFYEKNREEIKKQPFASEVNCVNTLILNYFTTRELSIPQVYNVPENFEGWVMWEFPEVLSKKIIEENSFSKHTGNINNAGNSDSSPLPNFTFFSKKSFEKPNQLFFYLRYMLDKFLNEYYFHMQAIPLIKFLILFSEHVLESKDLKYAYTLKLRRLYHNILTKTTPSSSESNHVKDLDNYLSNNLSRLTQEKKNIFREELQKFDMDLNIKSGFDARINFDSEGAFSFNSNPVILVEYLKEHVVWTELAEEYFNHGYYNYAKEYLEESVFHSIVLKDKPSLLKANLILAKIYIVEGNFECGFDVLNNLQSINGDIEIMFEIATDIIRILESLNKYDELLLYTEGLIGYLERIGKDDKRNLKNIKELSTHITWGKNSLSKTKTVDERSSRENIVANTYTLHKIISLAILAQCKAKLNRSMLNMEVPCSRKLEFLLNFYKEIILPEMTKYEQIVYTGGRDSIINILSLFNYIELILDLLYQTNLFIYMDSNQVKLITADILEKSLYYLNNSIKFLTELQVLVPGRVDTNLYSLTIHRLIGMLKIKHASINNIIGELEIKIKREVPISPIDKENYINKKVKQNQQVIELLDTMSKEIDRASWESEKQDINSYRYERSIAMLTSTDSLIPINSNEFYTCYIERINSFRLQAIQKRELVDIWDEDLLRKIQNAQANELNQNNVTNANLSSSSAVEIFKIQNFHQTALNLISDFEKILQTQSSSISTKDLLKHYFNSLELSGYLNIELSFKSLCEYQNQIAKSYFLKVVNKYLDPKCRDWVSMTSMNTSKKNFTFSYDLINSISYPDSVSNYTKFINDLPYMKNIFEKKTNSWNELKTNVPVNSSYFIFQMNEERTILYVGLMYYVSTGNTPSNVNSSIKNNNSNTTEKKFEYYLKRTQISTAVNIKIDNMLELIKKMKHVLLKSSIVTSEEMKKIYGDYNEAVKNILNELEYGLELDEIFQKINSIVNPELFQEDINTANQNAAEKNKKNVSIPEKPKKIDIKNKDANNFGDIILPTSNLESITFLIDLRLFELPFEQLSIFSKIPYKSHDFSFDCIMSRMKSFSVPNSTSITNNLPIYNSSQLANPAIKYFFDYTPKMPMKNDLKKQFDSKISPLTSIALNPTKSKENSSDPRIEGITSATYQPSLYELQKLFSNSGTFFFTSQTSFLYQIPPYELLDMSKFSKCKVAIVIDRIATIKRFVNQKSLINKNLDLESMPLDLIALMTLSGVNTILTTKWSLDYDEASELISDLLDESAKGLTISYSLNKYKNPKSVHKEDTTTQINLKKNVKDKKYEKKISNVTEESHLSPSDSVYIPKINKMEIFQFAPILFGFNNLNLK